MKTDAAESNVGPLAPAEVPVAEIDLDSQNAKRFCVSYRPKVDAVSASIRRVGLLQPPILTQAPTGEYVIVCGVARVTALKRMGRGMVPVRLAPGGLPEENYILASVEDNLWRGLSPVEIHIAIAKLREIGWSAERIVNDLFPRLGLPKSRRHLRRFEALRVLPTFLLDRMHEGEIDPAVGELLVDFSNADRDALVDLLFEKARFSLGEIRSMIDWLQNLAGRRGASIAQVVADPSFAEILRRDLPPKQKGQALRALARRQAFPRFTETAEKFEKAAREIRLGSAVSILPSENFERDEVRILIRSADADEIREVARRLLDACDGGAISELLKIARCEK